MQLINKFKFLLSTIDLFSKYAWVVTLKDKKGVNIVNAFVKIQRKNQTRYRLIKKVNFLADQWNDG